MPNPQYETRAALHIELIHDSTHLATGTAFGVQRQGQSVLLTARHNLTGRHHDTGATLSTHGGVPNTVRVWHHAEQSGDWQAVDYDLYDEDNMPRWREHPTLGARADIAALHVNMPPGTTALPLSLDDPQPALATSVTSEVFVVGYPAGYDVRKNLPLAVWTRGSIATEPVQQIDGLPVTLIDARTRSGQSGAPVHRQEAGTVQYDNGSTAIGTGGPVRQLFGLYTGRLHADADIGRVWRLPALRALADHGERPDQPWGQPATGTAPADPAANPA